MTDDLRGLTVKEIAAKRGVTLRSAYSLYQKTNRPPDVEVPGNQKRAILEALELSGAGTMAELQAKTKEIGGIHLDIHSLTHVVWSLQKQRLVRFRERKNVSDAGAALTAIRLTPHGAAYLAEMRGAVPMDAVISEQAAHEPLEGYPHLRLLMEKARQIRLAREAATLLEEAGEDEMALQVLDRHAISPAEEEIVRYLGGDLGDGEA